MTAPNQKEKDFAIKILLLGDLAVGKTSLIDRYISSRFEEDYRPTLGVNMVTKKMSVEKYNARVTLIIWDIAGQKKYDVSREMYFQGASGAFLVYDLTRHATFKNIRDKWFLDFQEFGKKEGVNVLIGNKCDLDDERAVSVKEGQDLAEQLRASDFLETSAKNGENVERAFKTLVHAILEGITERKKHQGRREG